MLTYTITLRRDGDLWTATSDNPALIATGVTLRDALDDLALRLDRHRREHDNAPHTGM